MIYRGPQLHNKQASPNLLRSKVAQLLSERSSSGLHDVRKRPDNQEDCREVEEGYTAEAEDCKEAEVEDCTVEVEDCKEAEAEDCTVVVEVEAVAGRHR